LCLIFFFLRTTADLLGLAPTSYKRRLKENTKPELNAYRTIGLWATQILLRHGLMKVERPSEGDAPTL